MKSIQIDTLAVHDVTFAEAVDLLAGWAWGLTMAFGMLMMLAFWAALIIGAVLLVRWAIGQPRGARGTTWPDDPAEILRRRYAAGEIDQTTYQQMKAELNSDATPTPREAVGANGTRR